MARRVHDAIKWVQASLRQHQRVCEAYDTWINHRNDAVLTDPSIWEKVETRQESTRLSDAYMVDAHLFTVTCGQLVKTLKDLGRDDLLALIPSEHITHIRNAFEHDDDRGLYRDDYEGYGWTVGSRPGAGPGNVYGLELEPVVAGLNEIADRLGPTAVLE